MKKTIGQINKEYGIDMKGNQRMTLVNWLKRKGFKSLAITLKRVEVKSN